MDISHMCSGSPAACADWQRGPRCRRKGWLLSCFLAALRVALLLCADWQRDPGEARWLPSGLLAFAAPHQPVPSFQGF